MKKGDVMIHRDYGPCVVADPIDKNDPTVAMVAYKVKGVQGISFGILAEHTAISFELDPDLDVFRKLLLGIP